MSLKSARVPDAVLPPFLAAEAIVTRHFSTMRRNVSDGTLTIGGERYVLVRAMSLSVCFFEYMKEIYPGLTEGEAEEGAGSALYDIAFAIGRSDARAFCTKHAVSDPIEKLSLGPIHFAHAGWAFVDILPESHAVQDDSYLLVYEHPHSFEADSWLSLGGKTSFVTCHMNAGYSSGWCSQSFGLELAAREILCRARGDDVCRFVMAPNQRLDEQVTAMEAKLAASASAVPDTP